MERKDAELPENFIWIVTKEEAFSDDDYTLDVTSEIMKEAKIKMEDYENILMNPSQVEIDNKKYL